MKDKSNPFPRTAAFFSWMVGDLRSNRVYRNMAIAASISGLAIGMLVSLILPWWVTATVLGLAIAGLAWTVRVAAAYGGLPWRN